MTRIHRVAFSLLLFCACWSGATPLGPARASAQLTIRVTGVPASTPAGATIYVAGTFNRWNPADSAYRLTAESGGEYALTFPPSVRGRVDFKFTLGSWETVEVSASGADVGNRSFTVPQTGAATYTATIEGWRDPKTAKPREHTARATVQVLDTAFAMPQLGRTRRIWLYLPPDYAWSSKRYPVLYMHDGQNVFDDATSYAGEWGVDEALDSLHAQGDSGAIVVAIDNSGQHRFDEYSPWVHAAYGGGQGDEYVDFIVHTLKPWIDQRYRTKPDRLSTGIAGSSMGGLISLYAALKYPGVFGRAGVFSPALWVAPSAFAYATAARPLRPDPRIYFMSGALEAAPGEDAGIYVRDQQQMVETLVAAGFSIGTEVIARIAGDGTHAEWFWRREFPVVYQWLFAKRVEN